MVAYLIIERGRFLEEARVLQVFVKYLASFWARKEPLDPSLYRPRWEPWPIFPPIPLLPGWGA